MKRFLIPIVALGMIASCCNNNTNCTTGDNGEAQSSQVLTAEEQANLTPCKVIDILKQGNEKFVKSNQGRVQEAAAGQFPKAVILSCLDSRVPVEDVFDRTIGDIFVARVAGNIVNPDILGSMEFACKVSGSKLIVVLGHGSCGAIVSAINDVELGNITEMLSKIQPAVTQARETFDGEATSSNSEFVEHVCHTNIEVMVDEIRTNSPILKEMEDNGEIKIVGAYYDMNTGKVDFFENL